MKIIPLTIKNHEVRCSSAGLELFSAKSDILTGRSVELPEGSPLWVFLLIVPVSKHMLEGIRHMRREDFEQGDDWMLVPSRRLRHRDQGGKIKVRKIRVDKPDALTWEMIASFARSSKSRLDRACGRFLGVSSGVLIDALISQAAVSGFPYALIAQNDFGFDSAQPAGTSQIRPRGYEQRSKKYPYSADLIAEVRCRVHSGSSLTLGPVFKDLQMPTSLDKDDASIARILVYFAETWVPAKSKSNRTNPRSDFAVLDMIIVAYEQAIGKNPKCRETSVLRLARSVVKESGIVAINSIADKPRRIERSLAERPLLTPQEILAMLGLDLPYPVIPASEDTSDWKLPTVRVLAIILVECMQRAVSLIDFRVEDIIFSTDTLDIYIENSKTGFVDTTIPAWGLLAPDQLNFLRSFHAGALAAGFPREQNLFNLAGIPHAQRENRKLMQELLLAALNHYLVAIGRGVLTATHLARATALTWAPIRAILVRYPELRSSPSLSAVIDAEWFSQDSLSRFGKLIPGEASSSSESLRRIACWASPQEFLRSYFRNWALLQRLHRERLGM